MADFTEMSDASKRRIEYLADIKTFDALLQAFNDMGMPMGSDRWAEHVLLTIKRMAAAETSLNQLNRRIEEALRDANKVRKLG